MNFTAPWIWNNAGLNNEKQSLFFRKTFLVEKVPESLNISISADSRYKLYINSQYICGGPLKSNAFRRYYDTINIASYLKTGLNIIAVHCLRFPVDNLGALNFETGPISLINSSRGGLFIDCEDKETGIDTGESWKVRSDPSYTFVHSVNSRYAGDQELCDGTKYPKAWTSADYDDSAWQNAVEVCPSKDCRLGGVLYDWQLTPRNIPLLYEKPIEPKKISAKTQNIPFEQLLNGKSVTIPANTECFVDIDMGALTTAYVKLTIDSFSGGETVNLLYSECYYTGKNADGEPVKTVRDECENGFLAGECDDYIAGVGEQSYEPYFFRTFRYLRLTIKTNEMPFRINRISFRLTGYPLTITGSFRSENTELQSLWDISVRTLERCMFDTYVDCPYYEQMQYVMDSMIQMLLSYRLSSDDRLARKALYDFHSTQRPDGMITCNSPASFQQIIPAFSIYFIDMVYYHYLYFGDKSVLTEYLPTVWRILGYFDSRIDRKTGLVGKTGYWEFVDWVDEWMDNFGSPADPDEKTIYIYSMIYGYGLKLAESLFKMADLPDLSNRLNKRYDAIQKAINLYAYDAQSGLYRNKPDDNRFSQHAQLWAVLSGCAKKEKAKRLMESCLKDTSLLKCSYSMSFFLFRALEEAGIYEKSIHIWQTWRELLKYNITTWPEDPVTQRSECHGWSALPVYEFSALALGIRPLNPGYNGVAIKPQAFELGSMSGEIATCRGTIIAERRVTRRESFYEVEINVTLPIEMEAVIETPDGGSRKTRTKHIEFCFNAPV